MARTAFKRREIKELKASSSGFALNEMWVLTLRGLISAGHCLQMAAAVMGAPQDALAELACSLGLAFTDSQSNRPNRHPKAWNATEYRDLAVAWLDGVPARAIAAQIGRSASAVYGKRRFLGLPSRRNARSSPNIAAQTTTASTQSTPAPLLVPQAPSQPAVARPLPHDVAIGLPIEDRVGLPWLARNSPQGLVLHTHKRTARMDWKGNRAALWEIGMRQLAGQHLRAAASDMAVSEDALRSTWSRTGLTRRSGIKSVAEFDPDLAEMHRKELGFEFLADPNMSGGHFWRQRGGPRLSRVFMKSQRYKNGQAAIG